MYLILRIVAVIDTLNTPAIYNIIPVISFCFLSQIETSIYYLVFPLPTSRMPLIAKIDVYL